MPYIKKEQRGKYNIYLRSITNIINRQGKKQGHLNYIITKIILETIPPKCYDDFHNISVLLHKIEHEIERRLQDPYEDLKVDENGDLKEFKEGWKDDRGDEDKPENP
jgi:hypothetical protein